MILFVNDNVGILFLKGIIITGIKEIITVIGKLYKTIVVKGQLRS